MKPTFFRSPRNAASCYRTGTHDIMAARTGSADLLDRSKLTMFICGNDDGAKRTVSGLINELGWDTADMGKAESARAIEPLCMLWCIPGFLRNEWTHAFALLKS